LRHKGSAFSSFQKDRRELSLPGPALPDLLQAVVGKGADFRFQARGFSMFPFIRDGDIISLSLCRDPSPRLGEVVAFLRPETERLLVHRVVGKIGDSWMIKGDNGSKMDCLVPRANILGCVTRVEREGRRIRLGLGPERHLIAFLSARGLLPSLLPKVWGVVRPFVGPCLRLFSARGVWGQSRNL
jgi:hypothetical protein